MNELSEIYFLMLGKHAETDYLYLSAVFYSIALYTYYHGIINHSGINFKSYWWQPWQPDTIFHDNHHQYFHVNFGFNCSLWDRVSTCSKSFVLSTTLNFRHNKYNTYFMWDASCFRKTTCTRNMKIFTRF